MENIGHWQVFSFMGEDQVTDGWFGQMVLNQCFQNGAPVALTHTSILTSFRSVVKSRAYETAVTILCGFMLPACPWWSDLPLTLVWICHGQVTLSQWGPSSWGRKCWINFPKPIWWINTPKKRGNLTTTRKHVTKSHKIQILSQNKFLVLSISREQYFQQR